MWKRLAFSTVSRAVLHPWFRLRRGLTLGVRIAARDGEGRYLLVRHTYTPGWLFPGGGVERGETAVEAAKRELFEEAGLTATGPLELFGLYANHESFAGDHVALFVVEDFQQQPVKPSLEIAETGFFDPAGPPAGISAGTARRLEEIAGKRPLESSW